MNSKLLKILDGEFDDVQMELKDVPYKAGVGSLMYAMVATKLNITFAASMVSQFLSKASPPHWMAMKCIVRYLKSTLDSKLCLIGKVITFQEFCDANWMEDAKDWLSRTGYMFIIDVRFNLWKCKKTTHHCIAYDRGGINGHHPLHEGSGLA